MIDAILVLVIIISAFAVGKLHERKQNLEREIYAQVHLKNSEAPNASLVDFLEDIEFEEPGRTSAETLILQVVQDNSGPLTYIELAKLAPSLTVDEVKATIKSLKRSGTISTREAGKRGKYYYVNDMDGMNE